MPYVLNKRQYAEIKEAKREGLEIAYIGRPSPFGNPFTCLPVANTQAEFQCSDRAESIASYEAWITHPDQAELLAKARRQLRGKALVCWCAPLPCHGDVLLRLVNED